MGEKLMTCGLMKTSLGLGAALVMVALLAGCGSKEIAVFGPTPVPSRTFTATPARTVTPTPSPNDNTAMIACTKLSGCRQCFTDQYGNCIAADRCIERMGNDSALCINSL